ncbi:MAG: hypothetical protein M9945_17545 [Aquamicrobium sp.]|uniref:hypothetical protein n=1 Tax=Aquamicrobium sp. TaxID=1872579 RepID=UPI00349EE39A|nr:hypothetical protein [Aquamicrobium sp.]
MIDADFLPCFGFRFLSNGLGDTMIKGTLTCAALLSALTLAACTSSDTIRTSANTAIVRTSAAPVCGGMGAARVAQQQAAIETIRAGFDRYMIVDMASANNVQVVQGPGTYRHSGTYNRGFYSGTTTYQPGMPMVYGRHEQAFAIYMFRNGEPGAHQAVPAREVLGDKWQELVQAGRVNTCM